MVRALRARALPLATERWFLTRSRTTTSSERGPILTRLGRGLGGDPTFSPPSDGGRPANSLTGTNYVVQLDFRAMTVLKGDGEMRLWRTRMSPKPPSQVEARR